MLSVVGMGYAYPENVIDNTFLEGLKIGLNAEALLKATGIRERRTVLPLDYITRTRNQDSAEALAIALQNPTDLGAEASQMALERAGISADEIGLVVAETSTPIQTTPSESQRVGCKLGMRAQAYDVASPGSSVPLFLEIFGSWKKTLVPDYVLCVSTSIMTHRVDYSDKSQASLWGDGAVAMVVSTKHEGKLTLRQGVFQSDLNKVGDDGIETYSHYFSTGDTASYWQKEVRDLVSGLVNAGDLDLTRIRLVAPQITLRFVEELAKSFGVPSSNNWQNVEQYGNTAGAGAAATLAMNWDKLSDDDIVVLAQAGLGPGLGGAILSVGRR